MKITKTHLRSIIKEELSRVLAETSWGAHKLSTPGINPNPDWSAALDPTLAGYPSQAGIAGAAPSEVLKNPYYATRPMQSFEGAGGYAYSQNVDGSWDFMGPDGKVGKAAAGSPAWKSIQAEFDTGKSLYTAPTPATQAAEPVETPEPAELPTGPATGTTYIGRGRAKRAQADLAKTMGRSQAKGAVRDARRAARQSGRRGQFTIPD